MTLSLALSLLIAGCITTQEFTSTAPATWSKIQPGMTKQEVHKSLGEPQTIETELQEIWEGHDRWKLIVTYDDADNVVSALNSYH